MMLVVRYNVPRRDLPLQLQRLKHIFYTTSTQLRRIPATPLPKIPPFLMKSDPIPPANPLISSKVYQFIEEEREILVSKILRGELKSSLSPKQYKTFLLLTKLKKRIPVHMLCQDLTRLPEGKLPPKHLTTVLKRHSGRNHTGRIVVRHQGGGERHRYRIIDFKRTAPFNPLLLQRNPVLDNLKQEYSLEANPALQKVVRIEFDPNRTAHIALLQRVIDGSLSYIVAPDGLKPGDFIKNDGSLGLGEYLPISSIPIGTIIHNVELKPGKGPQLARSAGTRITLEGFDTSDTKAIIILPSKKKLHVSKNCRAAIGQVSNVKWGSTPLGKAGVNRRRGIRPTVRGMAMNPVDHPHGGGKGGRNKGHHSRSPWGKIAK